MKKIHLILSIILIGLSGGCSDLLDLEPLDKLDGNALFSDPAGVELYMANLYYQLPVEDFNYMRGGFNDYVGENMVAAMFTDEATHSEYQAQLAPTNFLWWEAAYRLIRDANILAQEIPSLDISESQRQSMKGEVAFIKAYTYFALAKRYGGVPVIDEVQKWTGDVEALKVARSTEQATWDYVLDQCDIAVRNLPLSWENGERRATCWVAYALKSRAALHAASIAKFGTEVVLSGEAVEKRLVGLDPDLADGYYRAALDASYEIMKSGRYSLYRPEPATPDEAAENYRRLFQNPNNAPEEAIFIKGYTKPGKGHNYEIYYGPSQTANGWPHPGRMNPNLELVDAYESYDRPGESAPVVTSDAADDLTDYRGYDPEKNYRKFDTPSAIFEGKDARLQATVILPGTRWKNETIVIQAGLIKPDGTAEIYSGNPYTDPADGKNYYVFGGLNKTDYSGFDTEGGNYTRTGFSFKKFLNQEADVVYGYSQGLTDFMDFRYAEILLNYAEAAVESGCAQADERTRARKALNDVRRRAAHTVAIELTPDHVQRERLVEMAFEGKRFWDLMRRREYHKMCRNSVMHALLPVLDLRGNKPEYIFVRAEVQRLVPFTFYEKMYYHPIPGIGSNGLIQNPQY